MPVVTAVEIDQRSTTLARLYLDGEFAMKLPLHQAARLRTGQLLSPMEVDALRAARHFQSAYDRALRFLSYRPRSAVEVRRHLVGKGIAESTVASVIEQLCERGYLDDQAFVRFWLESRNRFKPMGPRALRDELRRKGVDDDTIEAGMSVCDAEDAAYRAAQSRLQRYRGNTRLAFRRKLSGMLYRRGFDSETINDVILRLQQELDESENGYFGAGAEE